MIFLPLLGFVLNGTLGKFLPKALSGMVVSPVRSMKLIKAITNEPNTAAVPNHPEMAFGKNLPRVPFITKPNSGRKIINVNISLSFQLV
jgi:hypothetical protein